MQFVWAFFSADLFLAFVNCPTSCCFNSIHQVPGLMTLAIMSFQTSRSRAVDIISVTLPAPNQDFRLSSIFPLVFPCFFSRLVYQWWENVPDRPISLHGRKMLLVALSSAPMICWFLPPSIPSHLFSSLSMVCATFFSGTTFLPPPIFSESCFFYRPCLTPVHQDRLDIALKGFLSRLERYVVAG